MTDRLDVEAEPTPPTDPIVREVHIDALPATVFEFFTDADKVTRWLAVDATLDPRPGGACHQVHAVEPSDAEHTDLAPGRYHMRGEFLEVAPPERVVFTWGFTEAAVGLPVGSSVVEVTLTPEGPGPGTRVRLVHRGLPPEQVPPHTAGWSGLLGRLARAVETTSTGESR